MSEQRIYGWKKQADDTRDKPFKLSVQVKNIPKIIDNRQALAQFPVQDQGSLGSCTANATLTPVALLNGSIPQSRLLQYYFTREIEGNINEDSGAEIRNAIKVLNRNGTCAEFRWPYDVAQFATKPNQGAIDAANGNMGYNYAAVEQTLDDLCLALLFNPCVVFGFMVKASFESMKVATLGHYNPKKSEAVIGGHAVCLVGYDKVKRTFLVRNSWGAKWGMGGYFTMPFKEVLDGIVSSDFWVVKR